jgi:transposase
MDDNARFHRSRAVTGTYLHREAVTSVPWSGMSPDLNPIDHIWDMIGRRMHAREPPVQNIRQLEEHCIGNGSSYHKRTSNV